MQFSRVNLFYRNVKQFIPSSYINALVCTKKNKQNSVISNQPHKSLFIIKVTMYVIIINNKQYWNLSNSLFLLAVTQREFIWIRTPNVSYFPNEWLAIDEVFCGTLFDKLRNETMYVNFLLCKTTNNAGDHLTDT